MTEKKGLIKTKKQMFLVIGVFAVVMLLGTVSYAFFNYTRTGGTNTVSTGRIAFNTDQNNDTLLLTNVFPSSSVPSGADSVAVHITGDTTYNDGEEFQITLVDVVNTINSKTIPINYVATYVASTNKDIGTSKATDDAYFTDRGSTTSVYKLTSSGEVSEGTEVLKGFIAKGATGIDGVLTIQAYLDSSKVLISDTIQDGDIEVSGYANGTPGAGMTVLTTAEWNALTGNNTLSFKIRAISNEGTWIPDPATLYATNIKCQRITDATKLHTEECVDGQCRLDGYTGDNTLITYGNAKALNTQLAVGDAFDCDVNGNGIIDVDTNNNSTERFYYISEYYNTDTKSFDNTTGYATLIYYTNTYSDNGMLTLGNGTILYDSFDNWHGPRTAVTYLPTINDWTNITLKTTNRTVLACNYNSNCITESVETTNNGSNQINNPFNYIGYAARLLTVAEIMHGCELTQPTNYQTRELTEHCKFLYEGTGYSDTSKIGSVWVESPVSWSSTGKWYIDTGYMGRLNGSNSDTVAGVRPTIDVPYSLMAY